MNLDVGEFPDLGGAARTEDSDPERIAKLTAHAVARIGDKFPSIRKFSRHLEGTERRAGLLSDVLAVLAALYKRNPDAVEDLARQFTTELQSRRAAQAASKNGGAQASAMTSTPKPAGGTRA